MNAQSQPLFRDANPVAVVTRPVAAAGVSASAEVFHRIEDVEQIWRSFTRSEIESPAQSYDFIRLWVADRAIAEEAQFYVVGAVDGVPVALLPLHRKRVRGVRLFTWFPGAHTGCHAPVVDTERLRALGAEGRAALWRTMIGALQGGDLVYLRSVPEHLGDGEDLFEGLGTHLATETLYRGEFASWEQCDREQRSRSRRKHDRQQGERLAALGTVSFEAISDLEQAHAALDIMFAQRSARFRAQGIRDGFVKDRLTGFYHDALDAGSGVDVRLHVLRLDSEIVAVRYNVVHGTRMFCLISSMSDCARIQTGSPGKQCLLRVMQTVFDQGISVFDMGSGLTDEKRHWCNVQIPLRQHYLPLTPLGSAVVWGHGGVQRSRAWIKSKPALKAALRSLQQVAQRLCGGRCSDKP